MTPLEMSTNNKLIPNNNNNTAKLASHKLPKFQVGKFVRVPDKCNLYSKGYTTNWNRELFKIHKGNKTNPVTYGLVDENNEQIKENIMNKNFQEVHSTLNLNKTLESMKIFHQFE